MDTATSQAQSSNVVNFVTAYGAGTVFMLVPSEGEKPPYKEDVLVYFNGLNEARPMAS